MKGPRSSFGALPENLSFDHGSTSNDAAIDSHISWNNLQTPQNRLQDYRTSSNEINNTQYLQHVRNEGRISEWSFGETSSSAAHHQVEELPYKPPTNILSLDNANVNTIINHSNGLPQDLNMISSQFGNQENNECRIIGSGDGRRISRKRKSLEFHTGQSSGVGNLNSDPNYHNNGERLTENELVANGGSELPNPRLGIGSGESPFSSTTSGDVQSYRRNFHLRVGGFQLRQVDPIPQYPFVTEDRFQNIDVSSSRLVPPNPPPAVENGSFHGQSVLLQASSSSRRNHQSRNIPEHHPMFVPASEMRNSASVNWSLGGGSSNSNDNSVNGVNGNVGSSSRVGLQYPRRLSEMVRRSLLAGSRHVGQGSNNNAVVRLNSPADAAATSQEMALPLGPETNNGHRVSNSRSALLERHLDGAAFGMPYSLRALAAAGEGRSSIMSEIRHVLDLMRRGEGLRFEDMMILENSMLFGMGDIHDRHRDMRLDVDNMSYEELLALEERIGNVCTGLSEKTIMNRLKQRKYVDRRAQDQVETEPCSICREEYKEWEDVGTLECGHDFHTDCIRQWLMQKNICPICKTTGLKT